MWRGYRVNYAVAGQGIPIVLVHGFGSNVHHFRKLTADLCEQYTGAFLWSHTTQTCMLLLLLNCCCERANQFLVAELCIDV